MNIKLILLMLSIIWSIFSIGQQLYSAELEVEDTKGSKLITLAGGDLLMASSRNGNLHLSRWNGNGDTLWTRDHQLPFDANSMRNSLVQLSTGEIVVSSDPVALLNEDGDLLDTLNMRNGHIIELGTDSLLGIGYDHIELRSITGDLLWETPLALTNCYTNFGHVLAATANGVAVYTACMAEIPGEFFSFGHIYVSRYSNNGSFLDSTLLSLSMSVTPGVFASTNTADGGIIFVGQVGSGDLHLVRTNDMGDTLWTRQYGYSFGEWAGRSMRGVKEHPDGRILLAGYSHEEGVELGNSVIMELDQWGDLICVENLDLPYNANPYSFRSDLAIRPDGSIHVLTTDLDAVWPWTSLYGYNELCFTTGIMDASANEFFNVYAVSRELIIEVDPQRVGAMYELYNLYGQRLITGSINDPRTMISMANFSSGVYLFSLLDSSTGDRRTEKVILP